MNMSVESWSIYYAKEKILVPTELKTTAGVGMNVDPMYIVDVNHMDELKAAILKTIAKGNPIVPHPSQEEMSKPTIIHKKLGFKSYKAFNHEAILWSIDCINGFYSIESTKVPPSGRGYVPDTSKTITFPPNTPVETVVDKLVEIIQQMHKEKMTEKAKGD